MLPRLVVPIVAALVTACQTATVPADTRQQPERARSSPAATLGIPPGHLPKPGLCRIWIPGVPPGRQSSPSRSCRGIVAHAPAGSWIVSRPTNDKKHVHVRVVDARRAGVIIAVRLFDAQSGRFVRQEKP